jgi:hypothetical protein
MASNQLVNGEGIAHILANMLLAENTSRPHAQPFLPFAAAAVRCMIYTSTVSMPMDSGNRLRMVESILCKRRGPAPSLWLAYILGPWNGMGYC